MMAGLDESKMEEAFASLMAEADGMDGEDPKQMASLMRKFTGKAGLNLGDSMEEAISRMEKGEDPDLVESEMGDRLEGDEFFTLAGMQKKVSAAKTALPDHDETLYSL